LVAEAEENNWDDDRWAQWNTCSLCEQKYHGFVRCALGWACWKTYVGRPEVDMARSMAMNRLSVGLSFSGHHADALSVQEAEFSTMKRVGASELNMLAVQNNLASSYTLIGRLADALQIQRDVYLGQRRLGRGPSHKHTLIAALNLSTSLVDTGKFAEAKVFISDQIALAERAFGSDHILTLDFQWGYSRAFTRDKDVSAEELAEVATILEETVKTTQHVLGSDHPRTCCIRNELALARR